MWSQASAVRHAGAQRHVCCCLRSSAVFTADVAVQLQLLLLLLLLCTQTPCTYMTLFRDRHTNPGSEGNSPSVAAGCALPKFLMRVPVVAFTQVLSVNLTDLSQGWGWREDVDGEHWRTSVCVNNLQFFCHQLLKMMIAFITTSENYTCMHMTLNIKRHINFLIRHIIYWKSLSVI